MDPSRKIPPPPSFQSAPDLSKSSFNIPSFSSAPDVFNKETNNSKSAHKEHKRRSRRSRSRSPSHRKSKYRSRSPKRSRSRERLYRKESRRSRRSPSKEREPLHSGELKTGFTFIIDKRGDPELSFYGGTHSYSVPAFRQSGYGRVLGFNWNERLIVNQGKLELVDILTSKPARYTDSEYAWKEIDKSLKRIRIKKQENDQDPFSLSSGYVQLSDDHQKKKKADYESLVSTGVDYRSLEGNKVRTVREEDEEEEEGESYNDIIRRRTVEYNQRLDKEPENVDLWLEFIRFQDEAAEGLDASATKSNQSSLNEVKLSIFEKALMYNPKDERLILAYLACGATIWDTLTLLREWDKQLKLYPDSIKLWSEYINTRQTSFSSFSFTECIKVFEDALSILKRQLDRARHREEREDIECLIVYIILRTCLLMKQSGYIERAYSVFQAIVEYNLFAPAGIQDKLGAFMEFWDNEVPRFGEKEAQGWNTYYNTKADYEHRPEEEENVEIINLQDWARHEIEADQKHRLPMRMTQIDDESVDEDPFRVTLFDDIQPFLFEFTTFAARQTLIYSIFVFLGLNYTPPNIGTNTHFFTDTFTHNDLPLDKFWPENSNKQPCLVWYVSGVPMEPEQIVTENDPFSIPPSYPVGLSELFAQPQHWFCSSKIEYNKVDREFTKCAFEQLLKLERSMHLTLCYLSFESNYEYKAGRKLAKSLLKDDRTNLVLWTAYAQMEKSHNKIDEARKVYMTALSTYRSFSESEQLAAPLMYQMFAKLEMENGQPAEALKILVSMSGDKPYDVNMPLPTATLILRAREYFAQKTLQLSVLSEMESEMQAGINMVVCSALFEYLSSGLENACKVFDRTLDYIKERKAERGYVSELVMTEYANLLYQHTKYHQLEGGFQPRMMRRKMEQAIQLFPNNTMFFSFYIWNESRAKVFNRVQALFNTVLSKESNVVLWLSAIYNELHRYKPYQANLVRDLFERSIQDINTKSSIILWKCYIKFELLQRNIERAKGLFYRSLRECPWSKELYIIGIEQFEKIMDDKELNELASLMLEKEIRLRTPITDLI
ncbi:unnamed protein product [Rhizopus microsporus]